MSLALRTGSQPLTQRSVRPTASASVSSQGHVSGERSLKILQVFETMRLKERLSAQIVLARDFNKKELTALNPIASALGALPKSHNEETLEQIKNAHSDVALSDIANLAALRQNLINIAARSGILPADLAQPIEVSEETTSVETPDAPLPLPKAGSPMSLRNAISYGLLLPGGVAKSHKEFSSLIRLAKSLTKEGLELFSEEELPIIEGWLTNLGIVL